MVMVEIMRLLERISQVQHGGKQEACRWESISRYPVANWSSRRRGATPNSRWTSDHKNRFVGESVWSGPPFGS